MESEKLATEPSSDKHHLGASAEFDIDMSMLMDWNHVIELTMKKANDTV